MTTCECWTDDVWRAIHIIALISSIKESEEKVAFCTMIIALNRIISCNSVEKEVCFFMEQIDHDLMKYMSSNTLLFSWTQQLREHICKVLGQKAPTLSELTSFYNPKMLNKDVWGPALWKFIHTTMIRAKMVNNVCSKPVQTAMKAFLTCTAILLPCVACRSHAWEYYSTHPINSSLDTNLHAFEWTVLFHNAVTERTNKEHGYKRKTYKPMDALKFYITLPPGSKLEDKFYTK